MEITFWNFKRKLLLVQNWQWHLKTNSKTMKKKWWMPMKDIKAINLAVVSTQTKNNTSCFWRKWLYLNFNCYWGKKNGMMMWKLLGCDGLTCVFNFAVTVKKKNTKKKTEDVLSFWLWVNSTFHQTPKEPKSMFRWYKQYFLFFWKSS